MLITSALCLGKTESVPSWTFPHRRKSGLLHALLLLEYCSFQEDKIMATLPPSVKQTCCIHSKMAKKSQSDLIFSWHFISSPMCRVLTWCSFVRHCSGGQGWCALGNRAWCHLQTLPLPLQLLFSLLGSSDLFFYH